MLDKIVSGGNSGSDQAAWRAARAFGIPTGGWMPKGFKTVEGAHPEFAGEYGAAEATAGGALDHIDHNVDASDATLWVGDTTTLEASAAVAACQKLGKPCMPLFPGAAFEPSHVAGWITKNQFRTLHVTGASEHEVPGIGERVGRFLAEVLERLGHARA
jgi:hypothetical protein